jgi:hypothetical protein
MAQAVSDQPVTTQVCVRAQFSPFEICGIQSGTETGFLLIHPVSSVSIIPPWLHTHVHHLGDKQYAHRWPQFRKSHPIKININKIGMIKI